MRVHLKSGAAFVVAAIVSASPAFAVGIITESFIAGSDPTAGEYDEFAGGSFLGEFKAQPVNLVTPGLVDGPYNTFIGSSVNTGNFVLDQTNGLGSDAYNADQGTNAGPQRKAKWIGAPIDSFRRVVSRPLLPVPASDTYWLGMLVNRGGIPASGGNGHVLAGIGNGGYPDAGATTGNAFGLYVGYAQSPANPTSFGDLVIRYRDTTGQTTADEVLIDDAVSSNVNITYNVVMKIDLNAQGVGEDLVTWFLDPSDFTSEATLAATSFATDTFSSFAFQDETDFALLSFLAYQWNGLAFFDEIRFGTELADLGGDVSALIPGDADGDGDVDGDDFNAWGGNFPTASGATLAQGDFDGDGDVDGDDFNVWGGNFPYPGPGSSAAAVIPEPASLALIGLGAVALLRRRS